MYIILTNCIAYHIACFLTCFFAIPRRRRIFAHMKQMYKRYYTFILFLLVAACLIAQTPIANRIKTAALHLPKTASVLAKYTDNKRHCLYYILQNKIYCFDVVLNINEVLDFTQKPYKKIIASSISPDGNYMLICLDRGEQKNAMHTNRFELWRINSHNKNFQYIANGFSCKKTKLGYTLQQKIDQKHTYIIRCRQVDLNGNIKQ